MEMYTKYISIIVIFFNATRFFFLYLTSACYFITPPFYVTLFSFIYISPCKVVGRNWFLYFRIYFQRQLEIEESPQKSSQLFSLEYRRPPPPPYPFSRFAFERVWMRRLPGEEN